jgi:hypothetical protein
MKAAISDPTAGKRARAIRAWPEAPVLVLDPADPRCGRLFAFGVEDGASSADSERDPTEAGVRDVPAAWRADGPR